MEIEHKQTHVNPRFINGKSIDFVGSVEWKGKIVTLKQNLNSKGCFRVCWILVTAIAYIVLKTETVNKKKGQN